MWKAFHGMASLSRNKMNQKRKDFQIFPLLCHRGGSRTLWSCNTATHPSHAPVPIVHEKICSPVLTKTSSCVPVPMTSVLTDGKPPPFPLHIPLNKLRQPSLLFMLAGDNSSYQSTSLISILWLEENVTEHSSIFFRFFNPDHQIAFFGPDLHHVEMRWAFG